jgi:hypothetical protein
MSEPMSALETLKATTTVTLTSRVTPPLVLRPFAPGAPSAGGVLAGLVVGLVRPQVTVEVAGTRVATVAPAGPPGRSYWPEIRLVLVVLLVLVLVKLIF